MVNNRNGEGYLDPTAYSAMKKEENFDRRARKMLAVIFGLCELSGFRIGGRIVLIDEKTGKVWK